MTRYPAQFIPGDKVEVHKSRRKPPVADTVTAVREHPLGGGHQYRVAGDTDWHSDGNVYRHDGER